MIIKVMFLTLLTPFLVVGLIALLQFLARVWWRCCRLLFALCKHANLQDALDSLVEADRAQAKARLQKKREKKNAKVEEYRK